MGHGLFRPQEQFGPDLVSAYIDHVGNREPRTHDYSDLPTSDPRTASYLIGRGCLLIVRGDDRAADRLLRHTRDSMRPATADSGRNFHDGRSLGAHLFHLSTMLLERDEKTAADTFQQAVHRQAVTDLKRIEHNLKGSSENRRKHLLGVRTEQLMVALLTRCEGIGTLTVRALEHHDDTKKIGFKGSYDLLLLDAASSNFDEPTTHQAQAKTGCQDFCNGNEGVNRGEETLAGYTKNIVLISGECDISPVGQTRHLARWLGDELEGSASPEVVETLDAKTLNLAEILIDPQPWRMGKIPVDQMAG